MDKVMVRESLAQREVRFLEIFSWSWQLMRERLVQYIFLTIIIFLPSNLLVSMLMEQLPETVDMTQYMKVSMLQLLANMFAMIACSVCVVMVDDQLSEEQKEKPFGASFYDGISSWPLFLLTIVLMFAVLFCVIFLITLLSAIIPILMLPAMIAVVVAALLLVVFMYGANVIAARHRLMLKRNIDIVVASLKHHIGKTVGLILIVSIIGIGLSMPLMTLFETLVGDRLTGVPLIIVETLVQTILSIVNIYADITVCLRFMNLEEILPEPVQRSFM